MFVCKCNGRVLSSVLIKCFLPCEGIYEAELSRLSAGFTCRKSSSKHCYTDLCALMQLSLCLTLLFCHFLSCVVSLNCHNTLSGKQKCSIFILMFIKYVYHQCISISQSVYIACVMDLWSNTTSTQLLVSSFHAFKVHCVPAGLSGGVQRQGCSIRELSKLCQVSTR